MKHTFKVHEDSFSYVSQLQLRLVAPHLARNLPHAYLLCKAGDSVTCGMRNMSDAPVTPSFCAMRVAHPCIQYMLLPPKPSLAVLAVWYQGDQGCCRIAKVLLLCLTFNY